MYDCLEDILFRGFMTASVRAKGMTFIFKTINMGELRQINEIREALPAHRVVLPHLAYSLYRVDGVNVLSRREEHLDDLMDIFEHFYPSEQRYFLQVLDRLNERSIQETSKIVPYTYGHRSKLLWNAYKGNLLSDVEVTGITGTNLLGLNEAQRTWIYLNRMEDQHSIFEMNYDLAKFIVSPHTKEIKKINDQEGQRKREEAARRAEVHARGTDEGWEKGTAEKHLVDQSVEELMSQIQRTLAGEKDFHDLVVQEHEDRIRAKMAEKARRQRMLIEQARHRAQEEMELLEGQMPSLVRPLTPAEMAREIEERRQRRRTNLLTVPDNVEGEDPSKVEKFNEKWGYAPSSFEDDYMRDMFHPDDE